MTAYLVCHRNARPTAGWGCPDPTTLTPTLTSSLTLPYTPNPYPNPAPAPNPNQVNRNSVAEGPRGRPRLTFKTQTLKVKNSCSPARWP